MPRILDGRAVSSAILESIKDGMKSLPDGQAGPVLAIIVATSDESALSYASAIRKTAEKTGISADMIDLGQDVSQETLNEKVRACAKDDAVHGIILQAPLAAGLDIDAARSLIPPQKDVDGAAPFSIGRLFAGEETFAPATARAVIEILDHYDVAVAGKHAVVIGRSTVVGKPVASLLLDMNATLSICHSATADLGFYTRSADILVVAAGKARLIGPSHIDPDKKTVIIDVGTNFDQEGKMSGDVDYDTVQDIAGAISPVPGGVGPVTVAVLLKNTWQAYLLKKSANGLK